MFDTQNLCIEQIFDALLDPENRHETRMEHSCNDEVLHKNPDWLLDNYSLSGRAKIFTEEQRRWS